MRAAVYREFGATIEIAVVADPAPAPRDVVVEVLAAGLCRSDLHAWHGLDPDPVCPHVGGHEFCGRVVAVGGEVRRVRLGERVVAPFVCGCGQCEPCRAGQHQVCRRQEQPGFTRWGAFARFTTVPWADVNAVVVPEAVDDAIAALVGCRVSTAYRGVAERGRLGAGEVLCVVGCGGVGLAAVAIGAALGAVVVAVDRSAAALDLAGRLGAVHGVRAPDDGTDGGTAAEQVSEAVRALTGGAHVAVDALGSVPTATAALMCLRPLGRHVQIGLFGSASPSLPIGRVIRDELELLGVHGLSGSRVGRVLGLLTGGAGTGRLELSAMVTRRISLDDVPVALPAMAGFATPGVTVITSF